MNILTLVVVFAIAVSSISAVVAQSDQDQPNSARRERIMQFIKQRRQAQGASGQGAQGQTMGQGAGMGAGGMDAGTGIGSGMGMGMGKMGGMGMMRRGSNTSSGDANLLDPDGAEDARSTGNSKATARDVAYGSDPLQKLDVYAPPKSTALGPVILFAHGGGWKRGDKKQHGLKGAAYSEKGVLFISTNYRLAPKVVHPKEIEDIASSFAWVKAHAKEYGGDPNRIYVMGHSAGAHLVDLLATNDKFLAEKGLKLSDVKGCISLDTASLDLTERASLPGPASKMVADMIKVAFGTDPKVLTEASPLLQLKKGKTYPPFLMICSANRRDSLAAHKQFEQAIHECGGNVTVKTVPLNHGEISQAAGNQKTEVFAACLAFVEGK